MQKIKAVCAKLQPHSLFYLFPFLFLLASCQKQEKENVAIVEKTNSLYFWHNKEAQQISLYFNDTFLLAYLYADTLEKPVIYPINTTNGIPITRGFPLAPRPGDRVDHPHHLGLWFNYGNVNGLDFWNNSSAVAASAKAKYGKIQHQEIEIAVAQDNMATLKVKCLWLDYKGMSLLEENTAFTFQVVADYLTIIRETQLTALEKQVNFPDNKEGLLGLRVRHELEHPTEEPYGMVLPDGQIGESTSEAGKAKTGQYLTSEGITGDAAWGTRAKWALLSGRAAGKHIAILMGDHPQNPGFPTYWHARGYGLFAANNLGQYALSQGKDALGFYLTSGQTATFRHLLVVHQGDNQPSAEAIENLWEDFATSDH